MYNNNLLEGYDAMLYDNIVEVWVSEMFCIVLNSLLKKKMHFQTFQITFISKTPASLSIAWDIKPEGASYSVFRVNVP